MGLLKKWFAGAVFLILACVGCVSIQDNVQVDRMSQTNTAQNITKKCERKPYVTRTILATGSAGLVNGGLVRDKVSFDNIWNLLTVDSSQVYTKVEGTNKPQVDWASQQVFFWVIGKVGDTCRKILPVNVETDCLSIFVTGSIIQYKKDCRSDESYPVFVYLMPKSDLPFDVRWTEDADGDGFTNESEVKVETDPLDALSHP
jgi:hypothetical protein